MLRCGKCGMQLVDGSKFCNECGTRVSNDFIICGKCGQRLKSDSKFCGKCGSQIVQSTNTKVNQTRDFNTQQEDFNRCPNCGSNISRMEIQCHFCGFQIAQRSVPNSVKSFAEELSRIEFEAKDDFEGLTEAYQYEGKRETEKRYGSKSFERKISFINSFPIPNTVEEIIEFILLAIANIDTKFGLNSADNIRYGKPGMLYYTEIKLATTWINKLEQAYNKALILFPDDPLFPRVQDIYIRKMVELNRLYIPEQK